MVNKKQHKEGHTREFRETAIKLALAGEKSIAEVARELNLPEWKLYSWVQAWKKKDGKRLQPGPTTEERLKQSEKRNKELELENEILKKAAAYFAKTLL
jgi:transposase